MPTPTNKILSGLNNDPTTYKFKVAAVNSAGTGLYSPASSGITPISAGFNSLSDLTNIISWNSATELMDAVPGLSNGVYIINNSPTYCLMDNTMNNGGWMLALKATRGETFGYNASYWTTNNTLNPNDTTRDDADAKFHIMNTFAAKDIMAIFPDITVGGCIGNQNYGYVWLQNNFYSGSRISLINLFGSVDRYFIGDANSFCGVDQFSSQTDVRFYGFNHRSNAGHSKIRWGFGWNENGGGLYPNGNMDSDDVNSGIGTYFNYAGSTTQYSAGDRVGCCSNRTGINRSARVEIYIR